MDRDEVHIKKRSYYYVYTHKINCSCHTRPFYSPIDDFDYNQATILKVRPQSRDNFLIPIMDTFKSFNPHFIYFLVNVECRKEEEGDENGR